MYNFGALIPASVTGLYKTGKNMYFALRLITRSILMGLEFRNRKLNRSVRAFSVGGADYGSVRVGAFMGRRIIQSTASKQCEGLKGLGAAAEEVEDPEYAMFLTDAKEQYLCNVPPHRYGSMFKEVMFTTFSNQELHMMFVRSSDFIFLAFFRFYSCPPITSCQTSRMNFSGE